METPEHGPDAAGAGEQVAPPTAAPPAPSATNPSSPNVVDIEEDSFRRAMGMAPGASEGEPAASAEPTPEPQQTELPLDAEAFKSFLEREVPAVEATPDAAVKPEGLSDDDWTDLQLLRTIKGKDEATAQQLAEARARILGEPQQFEVTEDAFKAALDGDAATFNNVVNSVVRAGAEHAVQAMLGQIAPYMERMQAQASTMIYENTKELFCSTVPGADKMRGNPYFEQAIHHIAKAAPETATVQALHRAMELTNRAYADAADVRKGGGKVHDVRPAGVGGGVHGGVRQAADQPATVDPTDRMLAEAWGIKPNG